MKDPNILEAFGLCMNGNPVKKDNESFIYEMKCNIDSLLRFIRKPLPAFVGSYFGRPIGEEPEPIIMPIIAEDNEPYVPTNIVLNPEDIKKHFVTDQEIRFEKIKVGNVDIAKKYNITEDDLLKSHEGWPFANLLKPIDCLSGNYEGCLQSRVKKEFSKFCKWLKYWFSPKHKISRSDIISDNAIKQMQEYSYQLTKISKQFDSLRRRRIRKKRYSISIPIIKTNR